MDAATPGDRQGGRRQERLWSLDEMTMEDSVYDQTRVESRWSCKDGAATAVPESLADPWEPMGLRSYKYLAVPESRAAGCEWLHLQSCLSRM